MEPNRTGRFRFGSTSVLGSTRTAKKPNRTDPFGTLSLAYKSHSESGAGTLLGNEEAFDEFLKDYQSIVAGNKKVVIIVILKELSKKHSHQVFIIFKIIICMYKLLFNQNF